MHIYIQNLKDTIKYYRLDYINCFEHPVAVICKYLRPGSEYLYILYRKLYQTFNYLPEADEMKNYEEEIGIRCNKMEADGRLIPTIEKLISKGHPVVVPGNLKALYYSRKYMRNDWRHLFLIKGYDKERRLFSMLDNQQYANHDEIINYSEFPIRYEDLEEVFNEYKVFEERYIGYFEIVDDGKKETGRLIIYLQNLRDALLKDNNVENYLIRFLKKGREQGYHEIDMRQLGNPIMNISKYKTVILEQLMIYLEGFGYCPDNMIPIKESLEKLWTTDNLRFVKLLQKHNMEEIGEIKSEKTREYERKLLLEIENSIDYLLNINDDMFQENYILNCENNQDRIITFENNQYIFNFNSNKTYNTWLSDECPKVVIYDNQRECKNFVFRVRCKVFESSNSVGHLEGIYIKSSENSMYTFGINYENKYIFDFVGEYMIGMYTAINDKDAFYLYVKKIENMLSVGIMNAKSEEKEFGKITVDEHIVQIGLLCKTWDTCRKLRVSFSEWALDNIEK